MPAPKTTKPKPDRARGRLALARSPSEQLAAIIRARGLSGYEVARLSGVDHSGVNRFLRGERDLKLATFDRIALALGLDLVERRRSRPPAHSPAPPRPDEAPGPGDAPPPAPAADEGAADAGGEDCGYGSAGLMPYGVSDMHAETG